MRGGRGDGSRWQTANCRLRFPASPRCVCKRLPKRISKRARR